MAIFGYVNRRAGALATITGIVFFVIFTGMSAAVVRAGIMGGIAAFAIFTGRQSHAVTALLVAAVAMAFWQPLILWYDIGFQLSFLATAGIIFITPWLERWVKWVPEFLGLKEAFLLTITAQIAVVPLIAFYFGRVSLIAPITNLAVAPLIILSMGAGFGAVLGGMLNISFGIFLGVPAYLILNGILHIAHYGALVPGAEIEISISLGMVVGYYLMLILALMISPVIDRQKQDESSALS